MSQTPFQDHEDAPHLTAREARQASWGQPVFIVLIASTVLAAIALLLSWMYREHSLHAVTPTAAQQTTMAQKFDTPAVQKPDYAAPANAPGVSPNR
jgi:uncharacterized membrane protein